ncbi:MAG: glutaredoxin [Bacteroidetes bacterium]|nr:glutaredoxin [Bacteroidota bacterium]
MFSLFKKKQDKKPEAPVQESAAQDNSLTIIPEELSKLPFIHVEGENKGKNLIMISLTTCGFCKKAMQFLTDKGASFAYIYLDKENPAVKKILRSYVSETFDTSITFPFLIIDNKKWISGFLRIEWEDLLK